MLASIAAPRSASITRADNNKTKEAHEKLWQPKYVHAVVGGQVVSVLCDRVRYTGDGRIIAVSQS